MKRFAHFVLAPILGLASLSIPANLFAEDAPSPLPGLDVFRGEFPLSLRFRSERYDNGGGRHAPVLAETQAALATESDGVLEKMLHDIGRYDSAGQQATAQALPTKIMLEHLLFGSISLKFAEDFGGKWPFSPCHFAYLVGSQALETPLAGSKEIKVADPTRFRNGDAVILLPVAGGKKLWNASEYAAVTGIEKNALHLKRAVYGTKTLAVACDSVWVAPMPHPYSESHKAKTQLTWNWSTMCPADEKGRQASDAFADGLRTLFAKGGALSHIHGIAWDVPSVTFREKGNDGRMVDADVDGVGDDGFKHGVNTYALGAVALHRKVREALGDQRVFLSDGYYGDDEDPRLQLPGVFNGIEHDINSDHHLLEISSQLNVFSFYQRYVPRPQLSLLVRKEGNADKKTGGLSPLARRQNECMKNAFATLMGVAYNDLSFDEVEQGKPFSACDETQCGKENRLHWLGKPIGTVIRPALDAQDTLSGAGVTMTDAFLARWKSSNAELHRDGQNLVISSRKAGADANPDRGSLQFSLTDVPVKKDHGLLIQFEVQTEKLRDFPADVPRIVNVIPGDMPGWPEKKKNQPRALLGWSTNEDFTPVSFYFREPTADARIAIQVAIQGQQTARIRNFIVRDATEVFARQYENGVVLCNPSERTPWTFDFEKLFPGVTLRRIVGSDYDKYMSQENNGEKVGPAVTLKPQTGLFLVKIKPE